MSDVCKLHNDTINRMDTFFVDVAGALKDTAVLDERIINIAEHAKAQEARIYNLEKLSAITENTVRSSLESLSRFGKELDKYSLNLETTNKKFVEMEKHVVLLTFKVGLIISGLSAGAWLVMRSLGV